MNALKIKNFRSLKSVGPVEIRPLTLVVGNNSSGKSTFLRALPLFRQGIEIPKTSPVLLYGYLTDFGSFNDILHRGAKDKIVEFEFQLNIDRLSEGNRRSYRSWLDYMVTHQFLENVKLEITVAITGDSQTGQTFSEGIALRFNEDEFIIKFDNEGKVRVFTINGSDILKTGLEFYHQAIEGVLPLIIAKKKIENSASDSKDTHSVEDDLLGGYLKKQFKSYFGENTKSELISNITSEFKYGSAPLMLDEIQGLKTKSKVFEEIRDKWTSNNDSFTKFRELVLLSLFPRLLVFSDRLLVEQLQSVSYIAPLRASAERYYRAQDLAVDEVDPQGKNLAMFLQSLTQFERGNFANWTSTKLGFVISSRFESGHISLHYKDAGRDAEYNIADMGFGVSQLLPIAAHLWSQTLRGKKRRSAVASLPLPKIIIIEQPELHLHPALQARVGDLVCALIKECDENKILLRLIIETHSETIINRVGANVANGRINRDQVGIAVFHRDLDTGVTTQNEARFGEKGELINWPFGFFEAQSADDTRT